MIASLCLSIFSSDESKSDSIFIASDIDKSLLVPKRSITESNSVGNLFESLIGPPAGIVLCSALNSSGPKSSLKEND